jgi:antitoxin ParD1/3/4
MNVSLTPELEKFVHKKVASGMYQTASEVVREGLRRLDDEERRRRAQIDRVRKHIAKGVAQADAGELVDGEVVFRDLRSMIDTIERKNAERFMAANGRKMVKKIA